MENLDASIVIATYNRADYLRKCLTAISGLDANFNRLEIIVVDNNSTDDTRTVIQNFIHLNPHLRISCLFVSKQGASLARNEGITQAVGEIIYFIDDDAIPEPDWLRVMSTAFENPRVGCVGGPAILDFQDQEIPPWLDGDLKGLLSGYGLNYSDPTVISSVAEFPFLCNMAVRQDIFNEVGKFRVDLGPKGNNLVVGEETELVGRIIRAGYDVLYHPGAIVHHLVSPERLEKRYIHRAGLRLTVTHICMTYEGGFRNFIRWFASDSWYAARMFSKLISALVRMKSLWFDDYMRFKMVALRVPLRIKAHILGRASIEYPRK